MTPLLLCWQLEFFHHLHFSRVDTLCTLVQISPKFVNFMAGKIGWDKLNNTLCTLVQILDCAVQLPSVSLASVEVALIFFCNLTKFKTLDATEHTKLCMEQASPIKNLGNSCI